MRVAFDFNTVIKTRFSGFYTFGINLLQAFDRMPDSPEFRLFYSRRLENEAAQLKAQLSPAKFSFNATGVRINHLKTAWRWLGMPALQHFTGDFDLYHSFHNMMPPTRGKPRILTIHDLRRYRLPDFYGKAQQPVFERAVKAADHIIADSYATRNDVMEIFRMPAGRVTAVPLACDPVLKPLSPEVKRIRRAQLCAQLDIPDTPYLLTISATDHRKNILRTIQAFRQVKEQLQEQIPQCKLLVAGFLPKLEREVVAIQTAAAADPDIVLAGPVDDLYAFTACSEGLLFNSLYEGFGIPILEAFAFDVPVLTSNCSSMPEVGGDAALYADPLQTDAIADGIVKLTGNMRNQLIVRGREQLQKFSWEETARQTMAVYRKLV